MRARLEPLSDDLLGGLRRLGHGCGAALPALVLARLSAGDIAHEAEIVLRHEQRHAHAYPADAGLRLGVGQISGAEIEKPPRGLFGLTLQRYLRSEWYTRAKASTELVLAPNQLTAVRLEAYITTRGEYVRLDVNALIFPCHDFR
jgi:hypothetical protein